MKRHRIAFYAGAAVGGAALGLASALAMAGLWPGTGTLDFGTVDVAGWRSDFAVGSDAADPYTRARVARHGLLALAKSEAVYFTRNTDDTGAPLDDNCRYLLSGGAMPSGWWSITLYDESSRLPANDDSALSLDASRAGAGDWRAIIAAQRPDGAAHWISNRNAGRFDLTLRLYMPSAQLLESPAAALVPPRLERLDCVGKGAA